MRFGYYLPAALLLSGCGASAPKAETVKDCASRFAALDHKFPQSVPQSSAGRNVTATFTFDVTGLSSADLREVTVDHRMPGALVSSTGSVQQTVAEFMKRDVDENGVLLIVDGKKLYRVRLSMADKHVTERGCAMQRSGMRLFQIDRTIKKNTDA